MHNFVVHSNESACQKSGSLALEQVMVLLFNGHKESYFKSIPHIYPYFWKLYEQIYVIGLDGFMHGHLPLELSSFSKYYIVCGIQEERLIHGHEVLWINF